MRPDDELLELLREEPDLLAIVDATQQTMRSKARRTRRVAPRVARAAVLAAAAVAAVAVATQVLHRGTGVKVSDKAIAALGTGQLVHVQLERLDPSGATIVNLNGRGTHRQTIVVDSWFDAAGNRLRAIVRRGGYIVEDETLTPTHGKSPSGPILMQPKTNTLVNPAVFALATNYRTALQRGAAPARGPATVARHHVRWVAVPAPAGMNVAVAVDKRSFKPILVRVRDGVSTSTQQVRVLETVSPKRAREEQQSLIGTAFSSGQSHDWRTLTPASLPAAYPAGVWLGRRAPGGLPLAKIELQRLTPRVQGHATVGLELDYGRLAKGQLDKTKPYLQIDEVTTLHPAYDFFDPGLAIEPLPPVGKVAIDAAQVYVGSRLTNKKIWTARLQRAGPLYVRIVGVSRKAVLEAARTLRAPG